MQTKIKTLFEDGYNKIKIAEMLGVDRKTVRKVLKKLDKDQPIETKHHPSVLDDYRNSIKASIPKKIGLARLFMIMPSLKFGFY